MKKIILIFFFVFFSRFGFGQTMDWASLSDEVNGLVNSLTVYNGKMVAGGHFTLAGSTNANRIAAWDGTSWSDLGSGLSGGFNPYVYKTLVFNTDLYAVGNFDSAGTVACKDVGKWNGSSWSGFGAGSNAAIYSLAFYNNELYVGGTFDTIGGVSANHIAKWNGTNWLPLGTGIQGTNVNDMYVFQNELFVIGVFDSAGSAPCNYVARWNGTNWSNASTGINSGSSALIDKSTKLLAGSQGTLISSTFYQDITQWDGSNWSLYSRQQMIPVRTFINYNTKLYCAGGTGTGPAGTSNVMVWDSSVSTWTTVGSGVNNYIQALCEYNGELYCGGYFKKASGANHNYISRYGNVAGIKDFSQDVQINIYPNPVSTILNIISENNKLENSEIEITNSLGQSILKSPYTKEIDISHLTQGYYVLKIITQHKQQFHSKFIKH